MGSKKSNSSIRWCEACIRIFPQGARVCPHCGAPTFWFSRLFFIHHNLVTAIIMLITAGVVGATLYFSYKQLNMQRELWVEEHRPKIKTKFNEVTRLNDTIFIANTLINYGLAASDSMSLHLIISDERMTPKRIPMTDQPSLDPDEHYGHSILIKPDVTKYLLDTFYIQMYFEFGWHGSSDRYRYNVNVRLIYDSASSKYQTSVIAKSKIPKRK